MKNSVFSELIAPVLSALRGVEEVGAKPKLERRLCSQNVSEHVDDISRYLAFVEDLETHSSFLHFLEISALPRYMHRLVVE